MTYVRTLDQLEALYPAAAGASLTKVTPALTPAYTRWIAQSRFCILATVGEAGTDASPRGDDGPVVRIDGPQRLLLPDWHGNNRLDSLRNIVDDGRASLMFLVPGSDTVIRCNGHARLSIDPALLESFERNDRSPRSVIDFDIAEVYFQCARALMRARLWASDHTAENLPGPGDILSEITQGGIDGARYDRDWPARAATTMW